MYHTVKQVSELLQIKPSTLYAWAAQGKIPCIHINGLLRFPKAELDVWLRNFEAQGQSPPTFKGKEDISDVDALIARAKRGVYTHVEETRHRSSPARKEDANGAL